MDPRDLKRHHLEVEATAFTGSDTLTCQTLAVGSDGITLLAPCTRKDGSFVRVQCALGPRQWLDVDAVLDESRLRASRWVWRLSFVDLPGHQRAMLDELTRQSAFGSSRPPSVPPAPPKRQSGMRPRFDAKFGKESLEQLYRDALEEVSATQGRPEVVGKRARLVRRASGRSG